MNNKYIILHLSLISEIGSRTIQQIVQQVDYDNLADLYLFSVEDMQRFGFSHDKSQRIVQGLQDKNLLDRELLEIEQHGADFVTIVCEQYPRLLKEIEVPPAVLYYKGNVDLFVEQQMFACVGARKAHGYTQDVINKIVVPMIQDHWVIVSGGALGADTYAHQAALDHSGKTIVVIGGGLYYQYPPRNKKMFEQIVKSGGLIVSSFPIRQQPEARCFPMRNRIISGMSRGCLVLQAARKSGALITAQFAVEQGREVFAIPGPIYDPLSAGCHELIKQGAKLVQSVNDIYEELQPSMVDLHDKQQTFIDSKSTTKNIEIQNLSVDEYERQILSCTVVAISTEQLLSKIMIEPQLLHQKLFALSLDGKIQQDCMGLWKRK